MSVRLSVEVRFRRPMTRSCISRKVIGRLSPQSDVWGAGLVAVPYLVGGVVVALPLARGARLLLRNDDLTQSRERRCFGRHHHPRLDRAVRIAHIDRAVIEANHLPLAVVIPPGLELVEEDD